MNSKLALAIVHAKSRAEQQKEEAARAAEAAALQERNKRIEAFMAKPEGQALNVALHSAGLNPEVADDGTRALFRFSVDGIPSPINVRYYPLADGWRAETLHPRAQEIELGDRSAADYPSSDPFTDEDIDPLLLFIAEMQQVCAEAAAAPAPPPPKKGKVSGHCRVEGTSSYSKLQDMINAAVERKATLGFWGISPVMVCNAEEDVVWYTLTTTELEDVADSA